MTISALRDTRPDLLVIGAGANGLAIGREAALSGLSVLIVDKGDIGAGTSAASSRMIHGGLRYLEGFEFSLVRESLRERERLLQNAGHLVMPMPLLVPVFSESTRSLPVIRAGLWLYDLLSFDRSTSRSRSYGVKKTKALIPGLKTEGLKGAVGYSDGQVEHSERLWIAYAKSVRENRGVVANYTEFVGVITEGARIRTVKLRDTLSGDQIDIHPEYIFNAAGPWVDRVLSLCPAPPDRLVGGAKGSHIILRRFPNAPETAIHFETEAGKPLLIIPWRDAMMIASTDQKWGNDDPKDAVPDDAEIQLLLSQTNRIFPAAGLTPDDIIDAFSGVRPLPYSPDKDSTRVTRSHFNADHPEFENLTTIVGGKITTCRQLGEDALIHYWKRRKRVHQSPTRNLPLPGHIAADMLADYTSDLASQYGLSDEIAWQIVRAFGSEGKEISQRITELDPERDREDPLSRYVTAASDFAFENEWARTEDDVLERRLALSYPELCRRRNIAVRNRRVING